MEEGDEENDDGDDDDGDDDRAKVEDDGSDISQWTLFGLLEEADLKQDPRLLLTATNSETSWLLLMLTLLLLTLSLTLPLLLLFTKLT